MKRRTCSVLSSSRNFNWRLCTLADKLRENDLATVHVLPKRFGELDRSKPFVADIQIKPLKDPA